MDIIKQLIDYVSDKYNDEEWYIFYDILKLINKYNDSRHIDTDSMSKLVKLLPVVNDSIVKSTIIEIIVDYLFGQDVDGEKLLCDNIEELFYEYIKTFSPNTINIKETRACLHHFMDLGIKENEIILKVVENLEEKYAVTILMFLVTDDNKNVPKECYEICEKAKQSSKLYDRANIISTFILITHPLCSKYDYIHCVSSEYNSAKIAAEDWGWNTPGGANSLIERKEFSEKEARILEKLGEMLFDGVDLDSKEIKDLYFEFFGDKDPYDVMFTLPS